MKALSFLVPVLNIFKHFGFLYRLIGIAACFFFFSSNAKDLMFLSTSSESKPITVEEIAKMPKSEIPRYLRIENLTLLSGLYVATEDEDGNVIDASYPVYSMLQITGDSMQSPMNTPAHVIIKDKNFDEGMLDGIMDIYGMYDDDSFGEVKRILEENGVKLSENAILVVKEKPPSFNSALIWTLVTGLVGLLILLSFIPNSMFGVEDPEEEEEEEA